MAAARKRQGTRARILDATAHLCAEYGSKSIVIEDVLQEAGVSRGTFYAQFSSIYDAMAAVSERISDELTGGRLLEYYRELKDPVRRITVGFQATLIRAALEPKWGRALAATKGFSERVQNAVRDDMLLGRKLGHFRFDDLHAVMDMHLGGFIRAAQRLLTLKTGKREYILEVALHDLLMLGTTERLARNAVLWASNDIYGRASKAQMWTSLDPEHRTTKES